MQRCMVLIFVIPKLCGLGVWGWGGSKVWVEVSAVIESYGIMWLLVCLCVSVCKFEQGNYQTSLIISLGRVKY